MKGKLRPAKEVAAAAAIQLLLATGKRMTVDSLREKLRECYRGVGNYEERAVASMSNVELIEALLNRNELLAKVGLQLRIAAGVVSLCTTKIENELLRDYIIRNSHQTEIGGVTEAGLEVLSCIAFKQPISQAEIDRYFQADKRGIVQRLRELELITEFAGVAGRLHYSTTDKFLAKFNLSSLEELQEQWSSSQSPSDSPTT